MASRFLSYIPFLWKFFCRGLESAHNKTEICVLPYEERLALGLPALCFWKWKIDLDFHFAYPLQEREIRIYSRRTSGCCDHSSCFIGIELTSVETKQEVQQCTNFSKIKKQPQNSRPQKNDKKQVTNCGATNCGRRHTKFSRYDDLTFRSR
jgi:hypothetical protein